MINQNMSGNQCVEQCFYVLPDSGTIVSSTWDIIFSLLDINQTQLNINHPMRDALKSRDPEK